MNILFAGTPEFAKTQLLGLMTAGHEIVGVLTQPDQRAGRGMHLSQSPVKALALEKEFNLYQPSTLKDEGLQHELISLGADVFIVAAYGRIIPTPLLSIGRFGAINVHASLLPRHRGAAPVERAIAMGDSETGVCIMQMTAGLDEGPVFHILRTPIFDDDNATTLTTRLSHLGVEALCDTLTRLEAGVVKSVAQTSEGITYAHKITTEDGAIDWQMSAQTIDRRFRAFGHHTGCYFLLAFPDNPHAAPEKIRIGGVALSLENKEATITPDFPLHQTSNEKTGINMPAPQHAIGEVIHIGKEKVTVQTADGEIECLALQRAGRKMMPAADVFRGLRIAVGTVIGARAST